MTDGPPKRPRILIADDDASNRTMLAGLVEVLGYESELAADGYEALAKMKLDIDLAIVDVKMPGLDGFQVTRSIRQDSVLSKLPIIITTGLAATAQRAHAIEAGANDFISKPVEMTELKARIESLLEVKQARDAVQQQEQIAALLREALEQKANSERREYEAHVSAVYLLAAAAEYRDDDSAAHIHRMSRYSEALGRAIGMQPGELERLRIASLTHDAGKIGIPDSILLKPGKLTADEFEFMKTHTVIGERILSTSPSELLQAGKVIAISHHEKWDGSGYPNGLAGEAIPLSGRICAVADVFDALTSERPYKHAFPNEQAFQIIRDGRGQHFDPGLVDAFLDSQYEIVRIQEEQRHIVMADYSRSVK